MAKKTKNNQIIEKVKKITSNLLKNLDIKAEVKVEEIDDFIKVNLFSEEQSSLIGYHGKNLFALQTIISQMIYHQIILISLRYFHPIAQADKRFWENQTRVIPSTSFLYEMK